MLIFFFFCAERTSNMLTISCLSMDPSRQQCSSTNCLGGF